MKISPNFSAFKISAKGMSINKKKMDLVSENIANVDNTKTETGKPYQRKYLTVQSNNSFSSNFTSSDSNISLKMNRSNEGHLKPAVFNGFVNNSVDENDATLITNLQEDKTQGNLVYSPDHPDANEEGYVEMPNVNIVNEMVEMIAATRSYEANLTAFNSSKQIAKDSLEI